MLLKVLSILISESDILVNNPSILLKSIEGTEGDEGIEGNCSGNDTVGVNILSTYIKYFPNSSTKVIL